MIVYKVCKKTEDGKYLSAVIKGKYQITYRLGKTIRRKLLLPLVFDNFSNARYFAQNNTTRNFPSVILECKAHGVQKINYVVGCYNYATFRKFWNLFRKDKKFAKNGFSDTLKKGIYTYRIPLGTLVAKELTPIKEVSFK